MLRAGICDLGTCDVEMGWPVSPAGPLAGPLCGSSAPPANGLVRPGKRDNSGHARRARRPACAQRRVGRPAARSARRAADLRRYLLADDDLPHLRPATRRVSRRDAARFRPGAWRFRPAGAARFPRSATAFPPGCRGVSARVPRCFRRTAGADCRAFPALASSQACDPFPGAAVRDGTDPAVRPPAVSR